MNRFERPIASFPDLRRAPSHRHRAARCLVIAMVAAALASAEGGTEVAGWQSVGWGGGSYYFAAAWHPTDPDVLYLGSDCAGVFRSADRGLHWKAANVGIVDYGIYALAVSPAAPDEVWLLSEGGLCRSADQAQSWTFIDHSAADRLDIRSSRADSVRPIAIHPNDGSVVYAGSRSGQLFKSDDSGVSWIALPYLDALEQAPGSKEAGVLSSVAISPQDPSVVFATNSRHGIFRSRDGGATWVALAGAPTTRARNVIVSPTEPGLVWAACGRQGLRRSADGGQTWEEIRPDPDGKADLREVALHPGRPGLVYAIASVGWGGSLYRSEDGGASWERGAQAVRRDASGNPTLPHEDARLSTVTNIALNPQDPDQLFISGNWRNVFSADGGRSLQERSTGADNTVHTDIQFHAGKTYVTAMDEGLLVSPDDGASWQQQIPLKYDADISGHFWRVRVADIDGSVNVVTTASPWESFNDMSCANRAFVSFDGGSSFALSLDGLPDYVPQVNCMWGRSFPRSLARDPQDPKVLYLAMDGDPEPEQGLPGGGVFRSVDGGRSWTRCATQPGGLRLYYGLVVDPTDSDRLFFSSCGEGGGAWRSEDQGATWEQIFSQENWCFNLEVAPSGMVLVGGKQLYRSIDHGANFERISAIEGDATIVGIAIDPADESRMWISRTTWDSGVAGGIYRSVDGGESWRDISGDIPYRKPQILRYNVATGDLWAGGVGLYKLAQRR